MVSWLLTLYTLVTYSSYLLCSTCAHRFMPCLKVIIENAVQPELKLLRGKTIECVSLIGLAVGEYLYMHIYLYMSFYTCLPVYVYLPTFICPHLPIHIYLSTPTCTHLPVHTYLYTFTCPQLPIHIYLSTPTCTHLSVYLSVFTLTVVIQTILHLISCQLYNARV